jgi:hypothetical protein
MRIVRIGLVVLGGVLLLSLAACKGGGGGGGGLTIASINLNPSPPVAGSVVQLSATFSGVSGSTASLIKNWTVSTGTVTSTKPDFALLLRATAKSPSSSSASTTAATVYWITPTAAGTATIQLSVQGTQKETTVNVTASPVSMSVTDGDAGSKVCTVRVTNITDLYQAAFRVNYSSAWTPVSAAQGDFLGAAGDTLWLGLTNQNGFVPCALTKRGDAPGNDGTGKLAEITFNPVAGGSGWHGSSRTPFELALVMLRNSRDEPIALH